MSVSRRNFLRSSAALSAALVLKPATTILGQDLTESAATPDSAVNSDPLKPYSRALFERHVGDTFRVHVGKQTVVLKLVDVNDLTPGSTDITTGNTRRTDCFSLRFHAAKRLPATATTHTLNHNVLGSFDLFTVQSKARAEFLHTAIVNHVA